MSGGSVFNNKGELIGIIFGLNLHNNRTMIIPVQSFMTELPITIQDDIKNKNKIY